MRKLFLFLIFIVNVFANTPPSFKALDVDHYLCGGSINHASNYFYMEAYPVSGYMDASSIDFSSDSKKLFSGMAQVSMNGVIYYCSEDSSNFEYNYPGETDTVYFQNNGKKQVSYKYDVIEGDVFLQSIGVPSDTPPSFKALDLDHEYCGGTSSNSSNGYYMEAYPVSSYKVTSNSYDSSRAFVDMQVITKNGNTYHCSEDSSNFEYNYPDETDTVFFQNNGYTFIASYKYNIIAEDIRNSQSPCKETPDNDIFNGLAYQGRFKDDSACNLASQDGGDGNGYQFVNDDLSGECAGFCYFNFPDSTNTGNDNNDNTNDNNDNSNTDNNTNDNTTDTNNGTDLSDLIPYLDEVEEKNENIKNSIDNLNTNLNTQFNNINSNNNNLNTTMSDLNSTLNNINNTLSNSNNSNNSNSNEPDYSGVADSLNLNPSIDSELEGFKSDIESSLETSFSSYSNVFGLGGYGSAPSPITFSILGRTYTVFDIKYLNPYIDHIRNIFLVAAYIFGLFLVFRGN